MKNHQRDNPHGIPNGIPPGIPNHDPEKRVGARTSALVLRVDFGHELAFCDGTIPVSDPAHVLASFKTKDLALAPNLFANIVRAAVALGAQFVYAVHHAPTEGDSASSHNDGPLYGNTSI